MRDLQRKSPNSSNVQLMALMIHGVIRSAMSKLRPYEKFGRQSMVGRGLRSAPRVVNGATTRL